MQNNVLEDFDVQGWLDSYVETKRASDCEIKVETCPSCLNANWKLYINIDTKVWFCQRCNWGRGIGDIVILLAKLSGLSERAIKKELFNKDTATPGYLAFFDKVGEAFGITEKPFANKEEPALICPGISDFGGLTGDSVARYAATRGLTRKDLKKYKLRQSYKINKAVGPFLVFPVYYGPTLVRWQARRITGQKPRFFSSPNIGDWLWPISTGVSNYEFGGEVILVEGMFDALGALSAQSKRVLCTYGNHITLNQVKVLLSLDIKKIYLAWDLDARKEIDIAAERLKKYFEVFIVNLQHPTRPGKTDPGDILTDPTLIAWFNNKIETAVSVNSQEYYQYRIKSKLGEK